MSAKSKELIVGGTPRAHLLPPEITAERRGRFKLRMLVLALVLVAVVVTGGIGAATWRAVEGQLALNQERERTEQLLQQQLQFGEVQSLKSQVDAALQARIRGTETEIDWQAYLADLQATLPGGMWISQVSVTSISPIEPVLTSTVPLSQDWVASLKIQASSATIPDVEAWLANLESLDGFAGVAPPVTVSGDTTEGYLVSAEVRVNSDAFLLRFENDEVK